jgi:methylenetetrahydrofolate dehydrogenase (NADP+)/methenyltetrahydrofolate cyclohydrolase
MNARILKGKPVADRLRDELRARARQVAEERGSAPYLAIVAIGGDAGSQLYLKKKLEACREAGIETTVEALPARIKEPQALRILQKLGEDPSLDGIILELPVPEHVDARRLTEAIPADKDVEGVTSLNLGRFYAIKENDALKQSDVLIPCTANAVIHLLLGTRLAPCGKEAVVIGRSNIVGRPVFHLLSCLDATVTLCHSQTRDLASYVRRADIVVAALGKPEVVRGDWIKPGAVVIDAGVSRRGKSIVGDVEFEKASRRAGFITPVPGGVGPLTVTFLLYNTVVSAERRTRKQLAR